MPDGPPTSRTATAAAALALLALILLLGAIFDLGPFADSGSGDSGFIASADRICSDAHGEFDDQQQSQPRTASEAAQMTRNLLAVAQNELQGIRALTPPANLRSKLDAYLKAREQGIGLLREGVAAADDEDFGAYEAAQAKLAAGQLKRQRLAEAIGFRECSKPSLDNKRLADQARPPGDTSLNRPNQVNNPPPGTP